MKTKLIQNCAVLRQSKLDSVLIENGQDVLIRGNKIAQISATGTIDLTTVDEIFPAGGMICLPGMMNTHAHVPMVLFRGLAEDVSIARWFNDFIWPLESNLTEEDVYWGAQLALVEMIENGVTTVADHYFYMDQVAEAVQQAGTRALLGWATFSNQGYEVLQKTADFAARWQNKADGRITTIMAPHAPYTCDDAFLRAAADHAKQLGIGIHIHASERFFQTQSSLDSRGITPIQVLAETGILDVPTIIAHGCGIIPEDIPILKQAKQVGVAHAPKTYLKLGGDMTPIPMLKAAGIPVGLATDGAASNSTMNLFEVLRLMAMLQKWIPSDSEQMPIGEALQIAFKGSAAVLGMSQSLGQIEEGFLADLMLVDLFGTHHQPLHNPAASLVYNVQPTDVKTVFCNGEVLMQDRQLKTLDKANIIKQVQKSMRRLAERVPEKRIQIYNP
ncbi:MAG: 5-methylthioadenosine/S-adenosylhomocysteine deaminase [Candidatus Promineifilaceae bacterium]|jgi:5-methylthioadenosine/S-adenosylhomocysteine deaminase